MEDLLYEKSSFIPIIIWKLTSLILLFLIIYYLVNIGNKHVDKDKEIHINLKEILKVALVLIPIGVFFYVIKNYPIVSDTFFTIVISIILAYILDPFAGYIESKGLNRHLSVLLMYGIILGAFIFLSFLVIPTLISEAKELIKVFPSYLDLFFEKIDIIDNSLRKNISFIPQMDLSLDKILKENISALESSMNKGLISIVSGVRGLLSRFVSIVLTPILTFYFLVDKNYFKNKIKKLIPNRHSKKFRLLFKNIDTSLSMFIRGRVIMAAFVGIATTLFLLIMQVDFALVIGLITGIADFIPYIGPFLGFVPTILFSLAISPFKALIVFIGFILIQWIENNIIGPKVLGDATGMHPMIILLGIIIGGGLFGVMGMILFIPALSIINEVILHYLEDIKSFFKQG